MASDRFAHVAEDIRTRVLQAITATGRVRVIGREALEADITCELCNDAQWWIDNGFSDAERKAFCGPQGLNCPGFEPESAPVA